MLSNINIFYIAQNHSSETTCILKIFVYTWKIKITADFKLKLIVTISINCVMDARRT